MEVFVGVELPIQPAAITEDETIRSIMRKGIVRRLMQITSGLTLHDYYKFWLIIKFCHSREEAAKRGVSHSGSYLNASTQEFDSLNAL